jgi:hypothetical protein
MMMKKKPQNLAGLMGASSFQPAGQMGQMTVDPIERQGQKMSGKKEGRKLKGLKAKRPKNTMMSGGY